jgi:hypothetical protein
MVCHGVAGTGRVVFGVLSVVVPLAALAFATGADEDVLRTGGEEI